MRIAMCAKLVDTWNHRDGFQIMWDRIKRIRNFGIYANQPILKTNIVDAALVLVAQSGAYKDAYLRFKQQPQNYEDLQQFFEEAERDLKEVGMEAQQMGYGGNAYDVLDEESVRASPTSLVLSGPASRHTWQPASTVNNSNSPTN